ncbi:NAD(P)-binding domain-containing protein [Plastorhodobacter daqingensis]|uniref:NAD(P)-binding domain-containing protein n=1 Tax=Plastorhodobacter daqingensis TaxID=1387281 RepID=A0ABW2ULB2_9RHOB
MSVEHVDTLIIGCGQAGLATSEHLNRRGVPHLILERNRIAESWRTARWDSLVANGPVWHDRFPSMEFDGMDPDAFAPRDRVVEYFVAVAAQIDAPVRCGVEATSLEKTSDGFRVRTSDGEIIARACGGRVLATGKRAKVTDRMTRGLGLDRIRAGPEGAAGLTEQESGPLRMVGRRPAPRPPMACRWWTARIASRGHRDCLPVAPDRDGKRDRGHGLSVLARVWSPPIRDACSGGADPGGHRPGPHPERSARPAGRSAGDHIRGRGPKHA